MTQMKRLTALALVLVLILSATMASAVVLRAAKQNRISASIYLSGGKVYAACQATIERDATSSSVKVYLQKKQANGTWKTVAQKSGTLEASTYTTASSGQYRAYAVLKVYKNNNTTTPSDTVTSNYITLTK